MRLLWTKLVNFRSYASARVTLHPRANLFLGPNGRGKTNLIEAVYFLATATPLPGHRPADLLRQGSEQARVAGEVSFDGGGAAAKVAVELTGRGRTLFLRDKPAASAVEYFGNLEVVVFTPQDVQLFAASPDERRRFLDRVIFNHDPRYLELARRFRRSLAQRNRLLVALAEGRSCEGELEAWDAEFAALAAQVTTRRAAMSARLAEGLANIYRRFFGQEPAEPVGLHYRSELSLLIGDDEPTAQAILPWLAKKREGDLRRRATQLGPHRDDLFFDIAGHPVRSHASQGQKRTLALALKLAEILSMAEERDEQPVVLLDDLSSELDADRTRRVLSCLSELGAQLLITSTSEGSWGEIFGAEMAHFEVHPGRIAPLLA